MQLYGYASYETPLLFLLLIRHSIHPKQSSLFQCHFNPTWLRVFLSTAHDVMSLQVLQTQLGWEYGIYRDLTEACRGIRFHSRVNPSALQSGEIGLDERAEHIRAS